MLKYLYLSFVLFCPFLADAHGVTTGDKGFLQEVSGVLPFEFLYLGAKHMMTGYDHLLFLFGIIFFLYRLKDVAIFVSIFAVSHMLTLMAGVYFDFPINAYIIDAIIGLSIVYKSLDNIGAFEKIGLNINTKMAVGVFGLFHGLGLAAKMQEYEVAREGLFWNLLSFNVGVEVGQILALWFILIAMNYWRKTKGFPAWAYSVNIWVMSAGFLLMGYQIAGFILS